MPGYRIALTAAEVDLLSWLVGRYRYAETLWKIMGGVNDDGTMDAELAEHQAWEFQQAVEEEDGFLPCCGGTLAAKMVRLLDAIV
jgi:hypothetical protein